MIVKFTDTQLQLTTFKCTGEIAFSEIENAIESFYDETPTKYVLWDCIHAKVGDITSDQVRQVATKVQNLGTSKTGGKTALVFASDTDYGMGRMYGTLVDIKEHIYETHVFHLLEEAMSWLLQNNDP